MAWLIVFAGIKRVDRWGIERGTWPDRESAVEEAARLNVLYEGKLDHWPEPVASTFVPALANPSIAEFRNANPPIAETPIPIIAEFRSKIPVQPEPAADPEPFALTAAGPRRKGKRR